jgi:hypothetical protein
MNFEPHPERAAAPDPSAGGQVRPDPPAWVADAIFYQIFPDRFAPSERVRKPGRLEPWDSPPSRDGFKGGDLLGIAEIPSSSWRKGRRRPRSRGGGTKRRSTSTCRRGAEGCSGGGASRAASGPKKGPAAQGRLGRMAPEAPLSTSPTSTGASCARS